jgi:hypothetical protein
LPERILFGVGYYNWAGSITGTLIPTKGFL